jgi:hypothetical protein
LAPGKNSNEPESGGQADRRFAERYVFSATAKVMDMRTQALVSGRISDLGLGGCYIDMMSPFAVESIVRVQLEREQKTFEAIATVIYSQPSIGMGLSFIKIEPQHELTLREWIAVASGGEPQNPDFKPGISSQEVLSKLTTVQQVLGDTIKLMVRKRIISEMEGAELMREMSG